MFIAHAPAAYIIHRFHAKKPLSIAALFAGGLGAIFPDIDLIYFYTIGGRAHGHHSYLIHFPALWAGIWGGFALLSYGRKHLTIKLGHIFLSCVMLHLVLDSIAGNIRWMWPLSMEGVNLVEIQNHGHSHWILNFVFHWTFAVEIVITLIASALAFKDRKYYIERLIALVTYNRKTPRAPSS